MDTRSDRQRLLARGAREGIFIGHLKMALQRGRTRPFQPVLEMARQWVPEMEESELVDLLDETDNLRVLSSSGVPVAVQFTATAVIQRTVPVEPEDAPR